MIHTSFFRIRSFALLLCLGVISGSSAMAQPALRPLFDSEDPVLALENTAPGGNNVAAAVDSSSASEQASKAIDGSLETKHFVKPHAGESTGLVITPAAGAGTARRIRLATGNDMPGRDPLEITVEGSNEDNAGKEGGTGFVLLYSGSAGLDSDPGRDTWGDWVEVPNDKPYKTYRVLITRTRTAKAGAQYSELALEGVPSATALRSAARNPELSPRDFKISFRSAKEPVHEGFARDTGKDYSSQNGLVYGWKTGSKRVITKKALMENEMLASLCRFYRNSQWEVAVENGLYDVTICTGSADDTHEHLPVLVNNIPYFAKMRAGKSVFLRQTKTVRVDDGRITLTLDPARLSKDWDAKGRFVSVPFLEVHRVESPSEERTLVWSVDSNAETDRQFYGLVPDIRSTSRPKDNLTNTLWYNTPAKIWEQGVPLGNGRLGAVVYGNPVREVIQLNEDTLWNGAPGLPFANPDGKKAIDEARRMIFENKPDNDVWNYIFKNVFNRADGQYGPFMFDYMNGGDIVFSFPDAPLENYYRSLDLSDGISTTSYTRDGVNYRQEVFSSADSGVLVIRLSADKPGSIRFATEVRDTYDAAISTEGNDTLVVNGKAPDKRLIPSVIRYQRRMKIIPQGGSVSVAPTSTPATAAAASPDAAKKSLIVENADAVTVLVAIRTNFVNYKDVSADAEARARQEIEKAAQQTYDNLRAVHVADHRRLYDRMGIDLGAATTLDLPTDERIRRFRQSNDPQMAALVLQFGRYLMIGCSRPGTQAANLQGIWNPWIYGAWGGKYTVNINIQMNYWLPDVANLGECNQPFFDLIEGVADRGRDTAKAYYGARGWVCHHNTDIWRYNHPIDGTAGMWPMASAWFCDHIWEHYQYTLDKEFLRKMYPVMREASLFYVDALVKDPRSGYLVTAPSMSPENGGMRAAPTMDVQILNSLFTRTCEAARVLGVDTDLQKQFGDTRSKLPPMMIGKWGQLQEWTDGDLDDPKSKHRHVSHLYGLHPGDQISHWKTPQLFDAAKVSLLARGDEATGWSLGWKTNFWARLRDGDHAYEILKLLIKPSFQAERNDWGSGLYPNFFDAHPPFQIDGNFGAAAGILEMLVQSQNGELDLLPALPSAWPSGNVRGMRTRGAFTVDLQWKDSKLLTLRVVPDLDGAVKVRYGTLIREFPTRKGVAITLNEALQKM